MLHARTPYALPALICALSAPSTGQIVQHNGSFQIQGAGATYATFASPTIAGQAPAVRVTQLADGWEQVRFTWTLSAPVRQDELAVRFDLAIVPDFQWIPHLAPLPGTVVGQHVFRSPAILVAEAGRTLALVPDLELCGRNAATPWFLDYDAPMRRAWIGMNRQMLASHVFFAKASGMVLGPGRVELGFYAKAYLDRATPANPFAETTRFLWRRFGRPLAEAGQPHDVPLREYVDLAYEWAYDRWRKPVWIEDRHGVVGGPQVFVDFSQSPFGGTTTTTTRPVEIWNQAWFSTIRTGYGMMRWSAPRYLDLRGRAQKIKELCLAAPRRNGLFPSVMRVRGELMGEGVFDLERVRWTNSDRTPLERGITRDFYHVLDASETALWMLRWYRDLEPDPRLLKCVSSYARTLVGLQDAAGFFPAWLHPLTFASATILSDSPETSRSATLLFELADLTMDRNYETAALAAVDAVLAGPAAIGRWEDFETYWSDNRFGAATHIGQRFARNGIFKQNTLSMFYTADASLHAYRVTGDPRYLAWGRRVLDELSMFQQVWQPPYMYVPTLGGFGVMNADGEWNDARSALFAELFMDYYVETGEPELFERGIAALEASFTMMYTPLNPATFQQWEAAFPALEPGDYGFAMENYGHWGSTSPNGDGMGFFAIFPWGAGSASEAFACIRDRFGQVYIDRARGMGFGIDSVRVTRINGTSYRLDDLTGRHRKLRVVFDDGSSTNVGLRGGSAVVQ